MEAANLSIGTRPLIHKVDVCSIEHLLRAIHKALGNDPSRRDIVQHMVLQIRSIVVRNASRSTKVPLQSRQTRTAHQRMTRHCADSREMSGVAALNENIFSNVLSFGLRVGIWGFELPQKPAQCSRQHSSLTGLHLQATLIGFETEKFALARPAVTA